MSSAAAWAAPMESSGELMSREEAFEAIRSAEQASSSGNDEAWVTSGVASSTQSWKDIYRILVSSLRTSSTHFEAITLETLALGWYGLSRAHAGQRDDIGGTPLGPEQSTTLDDWIYYARWAGALYTCKTPQQLASHLGIPVDNIANFQPTSAPLFPALYIAVDTSQPLINLVIRGTSTWHDIMTDLIAHSEPLTLSDGTSGQAHSGMLACARALVAAQLPLLLRVVRSHPGYAVHCIGHSLGGGVAALVAMLLRSEHKAALAEAGARGVRASGFGTPPVVSAELADSCSGYVRTLVHQHDIVPRTSVASLAVFRGELEEAKEGVFRSSGAAAWLRDSGALAAGKAAVAQLFSFATSATAMHAVAKTVGRTPAGQQFVKAGLQVGAAALMSKFRQLHVDAMQGPDAAAAGASSNSHGVSAPSTAACSSGAGAVASSGAGAGAATAAMRVDEEREAQQQLRQRDAAAKSAALSSAGGRERWDEEEAAARVPLVSPGLLLHLVRQGEGENARYELLQGSGAGEGAGAEATRRRFGRILLQRSMLQDHYLGPTVEGLRQVLQGMLQAEGQAQVEKARDAGGVSGGGSAGTDHKEAGMQSFVDEPPPLPPQQQYQPGASAIGDLIQL